MSTKNQKMQRLIRYYKDETGIREVDMKEVAKFAVSKGWSLPRPADPLVLLAKEFTQAAREEIRYDKKTGQPYRANVAILVSQGTRQLYLFGDIDEVKRKPMLKNLIMRREQMVGDGLQITFDQDHWNNVHPDEESISLPMDLTDDIMWRKNAPKEKKKAG